MIFNPRESMSELTYYVALPFVATDDGVAAGEPMECFNPNAAVMRAEALSGKPGTLAQSRSAARVNPATADFGDAKVIRKFGEVPDDLSALRLAEIATDLKQNPNGAMSLCQEAYEVLSRWAVIRAVTSRRTCNPDLRELAQYCRCNSAVANHVGGRASRNNARII